MWITSIWFLMQISEINGMFIVQLCYLHLFNCTVQSNWEGLHWCKADDTKPCFLLSVKIYLNLLFHNSSDDLRNDCLLLFFCCKLKLFFFYADNVNVLWSFPLSEGKIPLKDSVFKGYLNTAAIISYKSVTFSSLYFAHNQSKSIVNGSVRQIQKKTDLWWTH